jgi:hypothetical protein
MSRDVTPIPKLGPKKKPAKKRKPKSYMAQADALWAAIIHLKFDRCQFCGKTDGKLDAHHVVIRGFKATRTDTSQGLLLCFQCHQNVAHGDPFKAVLMYERIFGHDGYQRLRAKALDGVGKKYPEAFWRDRVAALEAELAQEGLRHG